MAGRIRTIKPELFDDQVTSQLSSEALVLFIALLTEADDHGLVRAHPRFLHSRAFHSRSVPFERYPEIEAELHDRLVEIYEVEGQRYARVRGWTKHQRVDHAGEPRCPLPPGWETHRETSRDGRRTRTTVSVRRCAPSTGPATDCLGGNSDLPRIASEASRDSIELPRNTAVAFRAVNDLPRNATAGSPITDHRSTTTTSEASAPSVVVEPDEAPSVTLAQVPPLQSEVRPVVAPVASQLVGVAAEIVKLFTASPTLMDESPRGDFVAAATELAKHSQSRQADKRLLECVAAAVEELRLQRIAQPAHSKGLRFIHTTTVRLMGPGQLEAHRAKGKPWESPATGPRSDDRAAYDPSADLAAAERLEADQRRRARQAENRPPEDPKAMASAVKGALAGLRRGVG